MYILCRTFDGNLYALQSADNIMTWTKLASPRKHFKTIISIQIVTWSRLVCLNAWRHLQWYIWGTLVSRLSHFTVRIISLLVRKWITIFALPWSPLQAIRIYCHKWAKRQSMLGRTVQLVKADKWDLCALFSSPPCFRTGDARQRQRPPIAALRQGMTLEEAMTLLWKFLCNKRTHVESNSDFLRIHVTVTKIHVT